MDNLIDKVLQHRDYNLAMQPLPQGTKREAEDGANQTDNAVNLSRKARKKAAAARAATAAEVQWYQSANEYGKTGKAGKGKGKDKAGKGKGKDKGKDPQLKLPIALRFPGVNPNDGDGNPICYAYNLPGGCDKAPPGGRCPKGRHVCMLSSCRQAHAYVGNH